ncbi:hypothetical protein JF544_04920 [Halobacillus kuroshimensis]|uniref:Uncharacterized protein n=2 Tax=Halobacillus kuroshimensis TaxID=302481 RepID=A0ABS3DTM2_9BACI|nr:hypothetical protein [Halobacillus kuroshimensis]MBN8234578.1 hypothetical protein [Halobacillus kuroshimensis]
MKWQGELVSGAYIKETNQFDMQQIKHFQTNSILSEDQLIHLNEYLEKHRNDTSHVLTINEQMLVPLNRMDVHKILEDFTAIRNFINQSKDAHGM